jgi:hypothetical protein
MLTVGGEHCAVLHNGGADGADELKVRGFRWQVAAEALEVVDGVLLGTLNRGGLQYGGDCLAYLLNVRRFQPRAVKPAGVVVRQ